MRIGISGHQRLHDESAWSWVGDEIDDVFREVRGDGPMEGISCLALGADQLFAERALAAGATLWAVLPFPDYEREITEERPRQKLRTLLAVARITTICPPADSKELAYLAAGKVVADNSELLIVVWDGHPAGGTGGTADIVRYAVGKRVPVRHLNPVTRTAVWAAEMG